MYIITYIPDIIPTHFNFFQHNVLFIWQIAFCCMIGGDVLSSSVFYKKVSIICFASNLSVVQFKSVCVFGGRGNGAPGDYSLQKILRGPKHTRTILSFWHATRTLFKAFCITWNLFRRVSSRVTRYRWSFNVPVRTTLFCLHFRE